MRKIDGQLRRKVCKHTKEVKAENKTSPWDIRSTVPLDPKKEREQGHLGCKKAKDARHENASNAEMPTGVKPAGISKERPVTLQKKVNGGLAAECGSKRETSIVGDGTGNSRKRNHSVSVAREHAGKDRTGSDVG